jgi:4-diphosphocytidyl-2C-methyl-D-erythritol kinase
VLLLPAGVRKESTAAVYQAFDRRGGSKGFEARRDAVLETLPRLGSPTDLAALPPNDLTRSDVASSLLELGAFRADVSGAGPTVYGLFLDETSARAAARAVRALGRAVVTRPCWYG